MRDNSSAPLTAAWGGVSTSKVHLAMKHTRTDLAKVGSEECPGVPRLSNIWYRIFTTVTPCRQSLIRFSPTGSPGRILMKQTGCLREHRMGLHRSTPSGEGLGLKSITGGSP